MNETTTATFTPAMNKVLQNTYALLSMTLLWSALASALAISQDVGHFGWWALIPMLGTLFLVMAVKNTVWALPAVFLFTGTMGYLTGPTVGFYLALSNGPELVMGAMGATAAIFICLSGYVLTSRKDFSFMGGFLFTGLIVTIGAMILGIFFSIPGLHLAISAAVVLIFSGYILYDTSQIIHGGETNYVMATVSLYLNILNIFLHLLSLFGIFGNDD